MKQKALALVLALCLALSVVPGVSAAEPQAVPAPVMAPAALPELAEPQAKTYSVTMTSTGPGVAELYTKSAGARESVYFLADPEPGYKVSFDKCRYYKDQYDMRLIYIGGNVFEIVMPDGDVLLNLEFVKIPTGSHNVTVTTTGKGTAAVDQKTAKKGESLFLEVAPAPGYSLTSVRARSGGTWIEGYYLGKGAGTERYEILMPDGDVEILVDFKRNGPYAITPYIDAPGGTLELSHKTAYELETVTVTAKPDRGYQVKSIGCFHSQLNKVSSNVWSFSMPKFKEEVHVSFAPIVYPATVSVELGFGGRAYLDREGATIGTTVTLTCLPDEGYRVARIAGAEVTDAGSNTYTFVMDNAPVELSVLFLRENNPFLDVNETNYYYDPVLWAAENGITNGVDATHFGSTTACTRGQVVTFLWRAAGMPEPASTSHPFTDVNPKAFYYKAMLWAVENGITNGVSADRFDPNGVCSRAQVVTFLHRSKGSPEPKLEENPFTDVAAQKWYTDPILWALENGVTTGTSATTFGPNAQCIRAQVVTFLYRAHQIPEPEPEPLPFPDLG